MVLKTAKTISERRRQSADRVDGEQLKTMTAARREEALYLSFDALLDETERADNESDTVMALKSYTVCDSRIFYNGKPISTWRTYQEHEHDV